MKGPSWRAVMASYETVVVSKQDSLGFDMGCASEVREPLSVLV